MTATKTAKATVMAVEAAVPEVFRPLLAGMPATVLEPLQAAQRAEDEADVLRGEARRLRAEADALTAQSKQAVRDGRHEDAADARRRASEQADLGRLAAGHARATADRAKGLRLRACAEASRLTPAERSAWAGEHLNAVRAVLSDVEAAALALSDALAGAQTIIGAAAWVATAARGQRPTPNGPTLRDAAGGEKVLAAVASFVDTTRHGPVVAALTAACKGETWQSEAETLTADLRKAFRADDRRTGGFWGDDF